MSLVSTWVQATDGRMYKDPTIRGTFEGRDYFICFDDDDPPELVLATGERPTHTGKHLERAKQILSSLGLQYSGIKRQRISIRMFSGKGSDHGTKEWQEATSFFFQLESPIPVPTAGNYDDVRDSSTNLGECVFHKFQPRSSQK
jgi:hypothetical protein